MYRLRSSITQLKKMTNILLISEDYIKSNSSLNDNVWGKNLLPAIREAEDMNLQQILGSCLYKTILNMVDLNTIGNSENEAYKELLDEHIQPYLLYQTQSNLVPIINIKMGNIGSVVSSDEYIQTLSQGNVDKVQKYFQDRADFYCKRMQEYIINHRREFPELKECECEQMRANLRSSATTNLWLGGARKR